MDGLVKLYHITTCNNDNMGLKSTCLSFLNDVVFFIFNFFSNIHEIENFANKIICIILVVYDT